ncbi:MAG: type II toxin-antitoxin system RelE/ParE family toxin [Saccharofermentans sp.]|nr:type II toxin-antitoxin system RelE/ParE family toxin [Saccharofermentans sp.]
MQVVFYMNAKGEEPAIDFLESLDPKMKAKMTRIIHLLQVNGNKLREPYTKYLRDGIFELRAKEGRDISRVLYFYVTGNKAVLTHGFVKKTNRTPPSEIERAIKYRDDYSIQD